MERIKVLPRIEAYDQLKDVIKTQEKVRIEFVAGHNLPPQFKPGKHYGIILLKDWLATAQFNQSVITFKAGLDNQVYTLEVPLHLLLAFSYETVISGKTIEIKRVFGKDLGLKLIKSKAA
jgi:hypothetical protein